MKKNRFVALSTVFFLVLGVSAVSLAGSISAKEIIKKVKKKYSELQSLQAEFDQTYKWELAGETQSVHGTLILRAGDNYRIETDAQLIVTDGVTVWTYSKRDSQVIIDYLSKSEDNPLPKDLLFKYSEEYVPHLVGQEMLDGENTYVLNLVPKEEESFIKSMKIWVDTSNWFTVKIEQVDINDNVNIYRVKNIQENVQLPPTLFKFEIPKNAEVVDLRESDL